MNVLDENLRQSQRELLAAWRIPVRQIGVEVGRSGMHDDEIISLLHQLSRPTLFTRDRDFYKPELRHARYCLVHLEVPRPESADYIRRLLKHPSFGTLAKRLGNVVRVSPSGLHVWRLTLRQKNTSPGPADREGVSAAASARTRWTGERAPVRSTREPTLAQAPRWDARMAPAPNRPLTARTACRVIPEDCQNSIDRCRLGVSMNGWEGIHMRHAIRIASALLLACLLLPLRVLADHQDEEPPPPGVLEERTIAFEGSDERYLLYVPASYDGSKPVPLVVVFRGGNTPAEAMLRVGLNGEADEAGFIVAYPDLERGPPGPVWTAFLTELLDTLQSEFSIDGRRTYVTGFSRGASVTHRIACELADRVAAVAAVDAAPLPVGPTTLDVRGLTFECRPARAVAVLHFHGTAGGRSPYANAQALIPFWAETNACVSGPRATVIEVAGERVIKETYDGCRNGAEVTLYTIEGGVHAWPGASRGEDDLPLGANEEAPASTAIVATPIIWRFFEEHPMP